MIARNDAQRTRGLVITLLLPSALRHCDCRLQTGIARALLANHVTHHVDANASDRRGDRYDASNSKRSDNTAQACTHDRGQAVVTVTDCR